MNYKVYKILIVILIFMLIATGCSNISFGKVEIDELLILNAVGVDRSNDNNESTVAISAASKSINATSEETSNASAGQKGNSALLVSTGETVFEAIRKLSTFSEDRLFWGHVDYILIGEDAAKDNLPQYLDFFMRDHELRLNSKVLIVKDNTAKAVFQQTIEEENFIGDILENLFKSKGRMSISDELLLVEIMGMFDNTCISTYIPCIELINEPNNKIKLSGFALFKDTDLFGYITDDMARGFNWVRGKIDSGVISVKDKNGQKISLEIIESKTKIKPVISDGRLDIKIKILFSTNITGVMGTKNIFEKDELDFLKTQQEEAVKNEVKKIIEFAQKNNMDIFGICNEVHHKKPVYWKSIKDNWSEIFPNLNITVEVDSNINRTYDIKQPVRSGYGVD